MDGIDFIGGSSFHSKMQRSWWYQQFWWLWRRGTAYIINRKVCQGICWLLVFASVFTLPSCGVYVVALFSWASNKFNERSIVLPMIACKTMHGNKIMHTKSQSNLPSLCTRNCNILRVFDVIKCYWWCL